jgi:hypothetical protein
MTPLVLGNHPVLDNLERGRFIETWTSQKKTILIVGYGLP